MFPPTNKFPKEIDVVEEVGENAKRLEKIIEAPNFKKLAKYAVYAHLYFLAFIFSTIVVVRFAFWLF